MAAAQINPFDQFFGTDGAPLSGGYVYVGQDNADPRQFPVSVYYDAALTIPAVQPLRTNAGYISRNGSPALVYLTGDYSLLVTDKKGAQVFYVASYSAIQGTPAAPFVEQTYQAFPTTGAAPAYVVTANPAITAYKVNQRFNITFNASGTTGSNTLNINGLGIKNLKQYDISGVKQPAVITAGMIADVVYDGTDQLVLDPLPQGVAGGQVRLSKVGANLVLQRFNGNALTINGANQPVPAAGVSYAPSGVVGLTNTLTRSITSNVATLTHAALASALPVGTVISVYGVGGAANYNGRQVVTASTTTSTSYALVAANEASIGDTNGRIYPLYYIYAYMNAGVMTLEAVTTGHSTDAATGVEIKTGDVTRTLVGMAVFAAGGVAVDTEAQRFVSSYFNRKPINGKNFWTSAGVVTSATYAELSIAPRLEFLTWANDIIDLSFGGVLLPNLVNGYVNASFGVDSTTVAEDTLGQLANSAAPNTGTSPSPRIAKGGNTEGYHFATLLVNNASAGNAIQATGGATPGARCSLIGIYQG